MPCGTTSSHAPRQRGAHGTARVPAAFDHGQVFGTLFDAGRHRDDGLVLIRSGTFRPAAGVEDDAFAVIGIVVTRIGPDPGRACYVTTKIACAQRLDYSEWRYSVPFHTADISTRTPRATGSLRRDRHRDRCSTVTHSRDTDRVGISSSARWRRGIASGGSTGS